MLSSETTSSPFVYRWVHGPPNNPNHQSSTTVFDSWSEVFVLICCVWFSFRCNLTNLSCAAMFFLERRGFILANLLNKPYLFSLFLTVPWLPTEACRVRDVALRFFAVCLSIAQSDLWVNLLEHPLWEWLANVFHMWIIFLSKEW